jgi:hypothetical protein
MIRIRKTVETVRNYFFVDAFSTRLKSGVNIKIVGYCSSNYCLQFVIIREIRGSITLTPALPLSQRGRGWGMGFFLRFFYHNAVLVPRTFWILHSTLRPFDAAQDTTSLSAPHSSFSLQFSFSPCVVHFFAKAGSFRYFFCKKAQMSSRGVALFTCFLIILHCGEKRNIRKYRKPVAGILPELHHRASGFCESTHGSSSQFEQCTIQSLRLSARRLQHPKNLRRACAFTSLCGKSALPSEEKIQSAVRRKARSLSDEV